MLVLGFRFLCRHLDTELTEVLENSVPPVELSRIACFRSAVAKHHKQDGVAMVCVTQF